MFSVLSGGCHGKVSVIFRLHGSGQGGGELTTRTHTWTYIRYVDMYIKHRFPAGAHERTVKMRRFE